MLADDEEMRRDTRQDLRAQVPEPSVAKDDDPVGRANGHLHKDLKRRGDGFSENGHIIRQRLRDQVKVALWNEQVIGKGAVVPQDPDHGSIRAMRRQIAPAQGARPAGAVDFTDDASAGIRARFGDTYELVTEDA